jgi:hypothetical protein
LQTVAVWQVSVLLKYFIVFFHPPIFILHPSMLWEVLWKLFRVSNSFFMFSNFYPSIHTTKLGLHWQNQQ